MNVIKMITKTAQKYYCKKCNKKITYQSALYGSGMCHSCSNKIAMKGCKAWNKGIKNSTNKYWLGKSNKNIIVKHHKYLKENSKEIIEMTQSQHRSLHWKCYNYVVEIGEVKKYIKEFIIKYNITPLIDDGKVIHHIDCNRENNNSDNFLYLDSKAIHNKLHQEAYAYLVKIGKIDNYLNWFFLKEKKNRI